jgi:hypothetical protein
MGVHRGGCHCGRVRFEVEGPANIKVSECNCSICGKSGFLGMSVPKDRFRLLQGEDCLTTYSFGTGVARHTFCKHCGIKSFYQPRSHPDGINVNVRCLDPETIESTEVTSFDGQHWEEHYPEGRATGYSNYPEG